MEDPTLFPHQYQTMNPFDYSSHDINFNPFSPENYACNPCINDSLFVGASNEMDDDDFKRPMKQLKTNSWSSCITENQIPPPPPTKAASSSSSSHIISFGNSNSSPAAISRQFYDVEPKTEAGNYWDGNMGYRREQYCSSKSGQVSRSRSPIHAQDHVIAERKRREKLSQSFISLAALIPGLKKTDKASVLGDAIKHLKQLQDRVNVLEKQVANKTMESVISVRKTQIYADDETISSSNENSDGRSNDVFPEIEARVSDKDVLIRIQCKNNKGCIPNIIGEVEKLHLFVLNTSVLPFGQDTRDITITAQMEAEFSMTAKDLVKSIRLALLKFIK
ncbi:Transcription factor bHLH18 [Hibiscus syriacus]|uniref:Transcription factor bHLH18 n=2 Tax=Hibiscus syriacus TaxID=106335 RepID=A0A6A2ZW54_HIBSY|nr:Transcription factor bHLH18 [Hibiscus syriacus]